MFTLVVKLATAAAGGRLRNAVKVRIRQAHPRVRLLYMSSYSRNDLLNHGTDLGEENLLARPFMPAELLARVQSSLS